MKNALDVSALSPQLKTHYENNLKELRDLCGKGKLHATTKEVEKAVHKIYELGGNAPPKFCHWMDLSDLVEVVYTPLVCDRLQQVPTSSNELRREVYRQLEQLKPCHLMSASQSIVSLYYKYSYNFSLEALALIKLYLDYPNLLPTNEKTTEINKAISTLGTSVTFFSPYANIALLVIADELRIATHDTSKEKKS